MGSPLKAAYKNDEGPASDLQGKVCLGLNAARSARPPKIEGSKGGGAPRAPWGI